MHLQSVPLLIITGTLLYLIIATIIINCFWFVPIDILLVTISNYIFIQTGVIHAMFGFKQVLCVCCVYRCAPFCPFSGSTQLLITYFSLSWEVTVGSEHQTNTSVRRGVQLVPIVIHHILFVGVIISWSTITGFPTLNYLWTSF